MDIAQSLLTRLLPVLIALGLGVLARARGLLTREGIAALKIVVTRITLPFVIFQAFYQAEYNKNTLITGSVVLGICLLLFGLGFLLKKRLSVLTGLLPFTLAGFEMGMLGFPLFLMLAGQERMGSIAVADLGQEVFVFTIYLFMLSRETGESKPLKEALGDILKNPVIIAVILGLVLGLSGLGGTLEGTLAGGVLEAVCGFVSAPTAVLILLSIGYDLRLERRVLGKAAAVLALRFVLVLLVGGGLTWLLFRLVPYDPWLLLAILTMLVLPAPFVLPVYSRDEGEKEFVSMYLSLGTLLFILCYAALLVLKPFITG